MLKAQLLLKGKKAVGFRCTGHADYADSGEDIICAAASFLSITCANALETVAGAQKQCEEVDEEAPSLTVIIEQSNESAETIFQTWKQGMKDLAQQNPQYVRYSERSLEE